MTSCKIKDETCGFRCTGYDGSAVWKKLHAAVLEIDCEECREHGKDLISGVHDLVNVGLGKNAHNAENFARFADEVACAYAKCKASGRC